MKQIETIFEYENRLKQLAKASVQKHTTFRYVSNNQNRIVNLKSL